MTPIIAVKCYGYEWMTELGLNEAGAARLMAEHGVDWALIQNTLDPLPDSDVPQQIPDRYDEFRFRDALRNEGIKIFESTAVFHQPWEVLANDSLRPVGDDGVAMQKFDWYLGVSPHSKDYLSRRIELMEEVVDTHRPDGIFLSFIRFPGFWEAWTSEASGDSITDYGFARGSIERFAEETGLELPDLPTSSLSTLILSEFRSEWIAWKCSLIVDSVKQLSDAANAIRPGIETMINGVAFPSTERGDIARRILGQDLGAISGVANHIETMVYHQILAEDPREWIPKVVDDLRPNVRGTLLPSIQTSPAYTKPPHDRVKRPVDLPPEQVVDVLRSVGRTAADGVSVYHWTDVATEDIHGSSIIADGLRAYKEGSL